MSTVARQIAENPYDARRCARIALPLLTYEQTDVSSEALKERKDAIESSINSQHASCMIGHLECDVLSYIHSNVQKAPNGKVSLPSLVSTCQLNKTCKFFSLSFKDLRTDIDATFIDRIDDERAVAGPDDKNLHKSRFILRNIVGGCSIMLKCGNSAFSNAPDGARFLIYRNVDPNGGERRYSIVFALAVPTENGLLCTPFDLDSAVRLLSGHDIKSGVFRTDDYKIKRYSEILMPTFEDDAINSCLFADMYSTEIKLNDVSNVFLNVWKTSNIFGGCDAAPEIAPLTISTSVTTCLPINAKVYFLSTGDFESLCDFLGRADTCAVARCRMGGGDDDCYVKFKNTVESEFAPKTKAVDVGNVDVKNVKPAGERRKTGEIGDLKSYMMVAAEQFLTSRGRFKRTAPQWKLIRKAERDGNFRDNRIAHDTDSEQDDDGCDEATNAVDSTTDDGALAIRFGVAN